MLLVWVKADKPTIYSMVQSVCVYGEERLPGCGRPQKEPATKQLDHTKSQFVSELSSDPSDHAVI